MTDLNDLLLKLVERGGSDLHITVGMPPVLRINGKLLPAEGERLTPRDTKELLYAILTQEQRETLERNWEFDFAYAIPGVARFRVNVYFQRNSVGAAFRHIPAEIMSFQDLRLPTVLEEFCKKPRGFILVTGPTGSGKSTTLAAMVDYINEHQELHIMTVEDPIEYLHQHKKAMVNQREVGSDTRSFAQALKYILRQDPDVVLIGEMRDLETVQAALTAAETGHLVLATLHTQDAAQTIDRIIDVFPPYQQQQVRVQLAGTLQGILSQQLASDDRCEKPGRRMRGARPDIRHPEHDPGREDPSDAERHAGGSPVWYGHDGSEPGRAVPARAGEPGRRVAACGGPQHTEDTAWS